MAKKEIKDMPSSVKARLTARAKEQREEVQSVLMRYGIERFLYRPSVSEYKDRFFLKRRGAFFALVRRAASADKRSRSSGLWTE